MTATREQMLEVARRAAFAAGEAILGVYSSAFEVQQKSDKTPVTEADLAAGLIIVEMLSKAFPDIAVASEELVEAEGPPKLPARCWAVDPLDGTREFIAGNGEFAVSIGLVEDGIPILGIVHGPAVGITYAACGPGTATPRRRGGTPEPIRARAQIRRARRRRSRPLSALRDDDGVGYGRRASHPRSSGRPGRNARRGPAHLRQSRPQERGLSRLGPPPRTLSGGCGRTTLLRRTPPRGRGDRLLCVPVERAERLPFVALSDFGH
jgi:Inositol monophosphatase family